MGAKTKTSIWRSWRSVATLSAVMLLVLPAYGETTEPTTPLERVQLLWGEILSEHTEAVSAPVQTRVHYAALRRDPRWPRLVAALAATRPESLATREQTLAYWINAYNILTIDLLLQNGPVESIRDLGSFFTPVWKREAGRIDGRPYTLHQIEHEILRPMDAPRIHGAIVCASISCPPLRREPYRPETLGSQLDDNLRHWLASPHKGARLEREARTLRVSRVFDWFSEDFEGAGGVATFVAGYLGPDDARWIATHRDELVLAYFDYDWGLND